MTYPSSSALPFPDGTAIVDLPSPDAVSSVVDSPQPPSSAFSPGDTDTAIVVHPSGEVGSGVGSSALSPVAMDWVPPTVFSVFDVDAQCHELVDALFLSPEGDQCLVSH